MKSSYNRMQKNKPLISQTHKSKKNSNISSLMYREIGEALKGYTQRRSQKNSHGNITIDQTIDLGGSNINGENGSNSNNNNRENGKIQRRRDSKNSNKSREKGDAMPFQQLSNNFINQKALVSKPSSKPTIKTG